jgi:TolB protein
MKTNPRIVLLISIGACAAAGLAIAPTSSAQPAPASSGTGLIGTVTVNGSSNNRGTCAPEPLPKIGVVPLIPQGGDDSLVQFVVHRDLELAGQYDVLDASKNPSGPYTRSTVLDLAAWRQADVEYVIRIYADTQTSPANIQLTGEVYATPPKPVGAQSADAGVSIPPTVMPKPAYSTKLDSKPGDVRLSAHRLADALLGGLTGTPGSFASQLVYSGRVGQGQWRQAFVLDSDGFNLHGVGPNDATSVSPTFGPNGDVYYALSRSFGPYKVVHGMNADPVPPMSAGSIMNIAFNADHTKLAFDVFLKGDSQVYVADAQGRSPQLVSGKVPLAHHPAFTPDNNVVYVGGGGAQQVYVGAKPISPMAWASAPVVCDTPTGTLVVYSVGFGPGATLMASDTDGANAHGLATQGGGAYPACSPDGRLIAFFTSSTAGAGPGLYITPIAHPCNAKKISSEVGESLDWEAIRN